MRLSELGGRRKPRLAAGPAPLHPGGEDRFAAEIARRHGFPFIALSSRHALVTPEALGPSQTSALRAAEIRLDGDVVTVLAPPLDHLPVLLAALAAQAPTHRRFAVTTPRRLEARLRASLAERTERATTSHIAARLPAFSARTVPTPLQKALIVALAALFALGAMLPLSVASMAVSIASVAAFLGLALVRLSACLARIGRRRTRPDLLPDEALPSYTVLVALYHEAQMLPQLSAALDRLDYPLDRLDIAFLVEEDDPATRAAAEAAVEGRAHMRVMVVPDGRPRTKPRALAYGLAFSRASLVAVYDAEDHPHPDQLRVAASALAAGPDELACVQARLEIVGARNWLQRQFLIEYAYLFSGTLPWLAAAGLPLPLGGTSNHFKRRALSAVGGWDPYNVTEDADLGARLARFGYRTGVIDSVTLETAPATVGVWLRQRRRWVKGWLVTALVHASRPTGLLDDLGGRAALVMLLHFAANILSPLLYPVWLIALALYFLGVVDPPAGDTFAGSLVVVAAATGLVIGFGSTFLIAVLSLDLRRRRDLKLELVFLPIYWFLSSWAAWRAVGEILVNPHSWAKTPHEPTPAEPDRPRRWSWPAWLRLPWRQRRQPCE
ncbi:glycosyltransferase family 2 protein [Pleomorphomonas koreensis]|uniref:glycosyltransferase family 2 protein n=1 Tax=Pleomorphomonas koreensis TaxID=257440 RepID=UPI00146F0449|nr:glycosyltransferase family 2 protein [Pleomorphomonas koreensis]